MSNVFSLHSEMCPVFAFLIIDSVVTEPRTRLILQCFLFGNGTRSSIDIGCFLLKFSENKSAGK